MREMYFFCELLLDPALQYFKVTSHVRGPPCTWKLIFPKMGNVGPGWCMFVAACTPCSRFRHGMCMNAPVRPAQFLLGLGIEQKSLFF